MLAWITLSLIVGVAVGTRFVPTAEELQAAFDQGQKFYASGAYDQALERYRHVATSKSDLLDEKAIKVAVGEVSAPLGEVAWYQIGNAYFKMAEEAKQRATRSRDEQEAAAAAAAADSLWAQAADYFFKTEELSTEEKLKALARSRILTCWYQRKDYRRTIEAAHLLLERYPQSAHVEQALYDIGWSYYELGDYPQSIGAFAKLVERFPGGYRASRALFQIGEAYLALGNYGEAIAHYRRLVESQRLGQMSEREILQMKREKLAGLVDETALDLAAKALIRIGVCHEKMGDYRRAAEAFELIATQFADDQRLVEEAYRRQADMFYHQGDFAACIEVYRRAIQSQPDAPGRARMQLLLANRYFETNHFSEAIAEYNTYRYTYPELAERVGLPLEGAGLQIARAWFGLAEGSDSTQAREYYRQAELELRRTLAAFPNSSFDQELKFNLGLALQQQGGNDKAQEALKLFDEVHAAGGNLGRSALFQIARLHQRLGDGERAAAVYRRLLALLGEAAERDIAHFELGLVLRETGDWQQAVEEFLQVRPQAELFARSRLEAGQVLSQRDQREQALEVFAAGLAAAKEEERALFHYLLGATQAQRGDCAKALEEFDQAIAVAGPDLKERALYGRGTALFKLERYEEAIAALDRKWEDGELADAALRLLAAAHATLGQGEEAMAIYRRLAETRTSPLEQAEYALALAEIAHRQQQYNRAIAACEEVLRLEFEEEQPAAERPYYLREKAYFLIADSRLRQEDLAAARATAQVGLAAYPEAFYTPDFLFLDGLAALQLELNAEAQEKLEEMLRRYPEHANAPYARYYLAYSLFNRALFEAAMAQFQQVVDQAPELEIAPDALFRVAECLFNLEKFAEAEAAYRQVIERFPDSSLREEALYNLAWCALNALPPGQADMAPVEAAFAAYLEAYPEGQYVPMAQYTLAEIYFNKGDYDRAYEYLIQIERRFPDSAAAEQTREMMPRVEEAVAYREYAAILDDFNRGLDEGNRELLHQVIRRFEEVWRKYPKTSSGVGALLNIGVCYQNLEEWKAAVQTFEAVIAEGEKGNEQVTAQVLGFAERRRNMIARKHL